MDEKEPPPAFMSALTTQHFVLQSALSANTSEVGTRASLYRFSLSSSLVALGFASRSPGLFVPFVAIVLPAVFILGLFTAVRLVDSNLEGILFLNGIARIRKYYRTLSPEAEEQFSAESGWWPENPAWPALQMGPFVGFITTTASMVAFINSIVGAVGVDADRGQRRPGADGCHLRLPEVAVRLGEVVRHCRVRFVEHPRCDKFRSNLSRRAFILLTRVELSSFGDNRVTREHTRSIRTRTY